MQRIICVALLAGFCLGVTAMCVSMLFGMGWRVFTAGMVMAAASGFPGFYLLGMWEDMAALDRRLARSDARPTPTVHAGAQFGTPPAAPAYDNVPYID